MLHLSDLSICPSLYPVTGQPIYLVHAPRFESLDIRLLTPQLKDPTSSPATLKIRARTCRSFVSLYVEC
jgi:hypothetical protein